MKAETKAKRRVTLSISGMGWMDETEVENIPGAQISISGGEDPIPDPIPSRVTNEQAMELLSILGECGTEYQSWIFDYMH